MIAARRLQRNFADGFIAKEVADLWEPWMRQADRVPSSAYVRFLAKVNFAPESS